MWFRHWNGFLCGSLYPWVELGEEVHTELLKEPNYAKLLLKLIWQAGSTRNYTNRLSSAMKYTNRHFIGSVVNHYYKKWKFFFSIRLCRSRSSIILSLHPRTDVNMMYNILLQWQDTEIQSLFCFRIQKFAIIFIWVRWNLNKCHKGNNNMQIVKCNSVHIFQTFCAVN